MTNKHGGEKESSEDNLTKRIFRAAADRRRRMGCILEHFIALEFFLSEVLEEYFMGNRYDQRLQFKNLVLDKLPFELKKQVLMKLKFEKVKRMNFDKKTYKDLDYFQRVRNVLSHNLKTLDRKKELYYVEDKMKGGVGIIYLDNKFVRKIEDLSNKIVGRLMRIKRVLEKERFNS